MDRLIDSGDEAGIRALGRLRLERRGFDGIVDDTIQPWTAKGSLHCAQRPPHRAVAFEPRAEGNLPHAIAALYPLLGFHVGQLVQQGAAGCVAESVESHSGRLHVPF